MLQLKIDINKIIEIANKAGEIVMHYYAKPYIEVSYKEDLSPVSKADLESNDYICSELFNLYPEIPIISEENDNIQQTNSSFWLIDPLDGTQSYLEKDGEFTINIALVVQDKPIIGVVFSPLTDELYYVDREQSPIKRKALDSYKIKARKVPNIGATVLISKNSANDKKLFNFLEQNKINQIIHTSSALKICKIAEGYADLYPRFGTTMEWDTAAGHAILSAAGGKIQKFCGTELNYGNTKQQYKNPEFIASGLD